MRLKDMNVARASCPASLSFIFKVISHNNLAKMGSVGVGCTIDKDVVVEAQNAYSNEVIFDGKPINFPTVNSVIKTLAASPVKISIKSPLPLGYGFGISSASSLATAFALNKLFKLGKTRLELAKIVHTAEIKNYTGLGSVATQITGGFLVKNKPGVPVDAYNLPFVGKKLYAAIIDRLETPTVLHDEKRVTEINEFADEALYQIKTTKNITLEEVIEISYIYVQKANIHFGSGIASHFGIDRIIKDIRKSGGQATMSMLGYVVLSTIKLDKITDYPVKELTITKHKIN